MKSYQINSTLPEFYNNGDKLHEWITYHPSFSDVPDNVLSILFQGFREADRVHKNDFRSNGSPYI